MKKSRVLIDARLLDGQAGGIQQVVCGIAQGLSSLNSSRFEIGFCVYQGEYGWLEPYLSEDFKLVEVSKLKSGPVSLSWFWGLKSFVRKHVGHLLGAKSIQLESEPESVKRFDPDLVHFVHQHCFQTDRPFLFTPHDLQHEYFPEYFDKRTLMVRRILYRKYAQESSAVVCISDSCRRDVVRYLGVESKKCPVIYNAPLNGGINLKNSERNRISESHDLPKDFLFYPAKTYAHKNHKRLIEALCLLKSEGLCVPLICSGPLTSYYEETIQPYLKEMRMEKQVRFLGWLDESKVAALYDLATAIIFPSEFEGFGLPLIEAMRAGLPVCCSNTSCVPEIVAGAALTFDPKDPGAIAGAIKKIWEDRDLQSTLSERGKLRGEGFSWDRSAKLYLDLYTSLLCNPSDGTRSVAS